MEGARGGGVCCLLEVSETETAPTFVSLWYISLY